MPKQLLDDNFCFLGHFVIISIALKCNGGNVLAFFGQFFDFEGCFSFSVSFGFIGFAFDF